LLKSGPLKQQPGWGLRSLASRPRSLIHHRNFLRTATAILLLKYSLTASLFEAHAVFLIDAEGNDDSGREDSAAHDHVLLQGVGVGNANRCVLLRREVRQLCCQASELFGRKDAGQLIEGLAAKDRRGSGNPDTAAEDA
jgi:hypothetical protein